MDNNMENGNFINNILDKMKNNKKIVVIAGAVLVLAVILIIILSSCGGKTSKAPKTPSASKSEHVKGDHLVKEDEEKVEYDFTPYFGEYNLVRALSDVDLPVPECIKFWRYGFMMDFDRNKYGSNALMDLKIYVNDNGYDIIIDEIDGKEVLRSPSYSNTERDFILYKSGDTFILEIDYNGSFIPFAEYERIDKGWN